MLFLMVKSLQADNSKFPELSMEPMNFKPKAHMCIATMQQEGVHEILAFISLVTACVWCSYFPAEGNLAIESHCILHG
jgi:hypothetical protein